MSSWHYQEQKRFMEDWMNIRIKNEPPQYSHIYRQTEDEGEGVRYIKLVYTKVG